MKQAPARDRFAAVAVDVVLFGIIDDTLHALVDTVDRPPHYIDIEAFIGGLIESSETAEMAIARHLATKGSLQSSYIEQLCTFSALERDKRNRVISIAYLGLVRPATVETYKHASARWVPIAKLRNLAYDHNQMLATALERLRGKLTYTTIANHLLPNHFTLSELQRVYEIVLNQTLDKRNFRKKILALDVVKETGRMQEGVQNRPAALYTFKQNKVEELTLIV